MATNNESTMQFSAPVAGMFAMYGDQNVKNAVTGTHTVTKRTNMQKASLRRKHR